MLHPLPFFPFIFPFLFLVPFLISNLPCLFGTTILIWSEGCQSVEGSDDVNMILSGVGLVWIKHG